MNRYHAVIANKYARRWIASFWITRVPYFDRIDPMLMTNNVLEMEQSKAIFLDYLESANDMMPRPKLAIVEV